MVEASDGRLCDWQNRNRSESAQGCRSKVEREKQTKRWERALMDQCSDLDTMDAVDTRMQRATGGERRESSRQKADVERVSTGLHKRSRQRAARDCKTFGSVHHAPLALFGVDCHCEYARSHIELKSAIFQVCTCSPAAPTREAAEIEGRSRSGFGCFGFVLGTKRSLCTAPALHFDRLSESQ